MKLMPQHLPCAVIRAYWLACDGGLLPHAQARDPSLPNDHCYTQVWIFAWLATLVETPFTEMQGARDAWLQLFTLKVGWG